RGVRGAGGRRQVAAARGAGPHLVTGAVVLLRGGRPSPATLATNGRPRTGHPPGRRRPVAPRAAPVGRRRGDGRGAPSAGGLRCWTPRRCWRSPCRGRR